MGWRCQVEGRDWLWRLLGLDTVKRVLRGLYYGKAAPTNNEAEALVMVDCVEWALE